MNQSLLVTLVLIAPSLAGAGEPPPPAFSSALVTTPSSPPAKAQEAEMYVYLSADGKQTKVSLFDPASALTPVARVDGDGIPLDELSDALLVSHRDRTDGAAKQHDFEPVLDRIIDMKLMVLEAREMGLDELPDVKQAIEREQESQLIQRVRASATARAKPDRATVERFYKDAVREWSLRSLLFAKGEDAKELVSALKAKKDFVATGKRLLDEKKATGTTEASWVGAGAMLPQVYTAVSRLKPGRVEVVRVNDGWAVVQFLAVRYPENPQVRAQAEERAMVAAQQNAALKLYKDLQDHHARIDKKLLKRLDFEARKPGFAALKKDRRTLARIPGDAPLTVADLSAGMEEKFFHGIEAPIKEHRANAAKEEVFYTLLQRRLVLQEARRLGIAQRPEFQRYMARFTEATLFSAYVERVVMPDVKVSEADGQKYYAEHKGEFAIPAMYRLDSIVFEKQRDAEDALKKLRGGTDFKWMRANATGQVKEDQRAARLDGNVVSANALPPALRSQLAGAKLGDFRMQEIGGQSFVVRVASVTEGTEQPYPQVRADIGRKLVAEKLKKSIQGNAAKLRGAHQIAVYVTRIGF